MQNAAKSQRRTVLFKGFFSSFLNKHSGATPKKQSQRWGTWTDHKIKSLVDKYYEGLTSAPKKHTKKNQFGFRGFSNSTPKLWVPHHRKIRWVDSLAAFCRHLKTDLFSEWLSPCVFCFILILMTFSLTCLSCKCRHLPRTNTHFNFVTNMHIYFVSFTHTHPINFVSSAHTHHIQELLLQVLVQKSSINLWQKLEIPLFVSLNSKFYAWKIQNFERQSAFPERFIDLHGFPEWDLFSSPFFKIQKPNLIDYISSHL